ncbi:MAG: lmo0937 family membrane protein [Deltaproteobacteria bacterium]|nr:lmo0937 family membrane protein [Deltaproteobacteria bacterium]
MLWTIAVVLIIFWLLGLVSGYTMGSFIHILFVAAVALLVVSLSQEVMINRKLRHLLRGRSQNRISNGGMSG